MPKQKTHRASAKRFKRTGNGGLKRAHAFTSHRFHGKTKKQRRQLRMLQCKIASLLCFAEAIVGSFFQRTDQFCESRITSG